MSKDDHEDCCDEDDDDTDTFTEENHCYQVLHRLRGHSGKKYWKYAENIFDWLTGCVKIFKKAYEFYHLGKFIPEHKRGKDVDLFRGEVRAFSKKKTYGKNGHMKSCH